MNFEIDNNEIEKSFDRIALELLKRQALVVNNKVFGFTEIEFYYFNEDYHQDKYTHPHERQSGEWRFHNQGIDITFAGSEKCDGGILIRGVLIDSEYVNGPRNSMRRIFEAFGKVTEPTSIILKDGEIRNISIIKTFRHLPNKNTYPEFHQKYYRYLTDLEHLKIPASVKKEIETNCNVL